MSCRYPAHQSRRTNPSASSRSQSARNTPRYVSGLAVGPGGNTVAVYMAEPDTRRSFSSDQKDPLNELEATQLQNCILNQFSCYSLFFTHLCSRTATPGELRIRFECALPKEDAHVHNLMYMTAAVLRAGPQEFMAHTWPVSFAAELPTNFMEDNAKVDRLLRAINAALDNHIAITREYISDVLVQQVESEMSAEVASKAV